MKRILIVHLFKLCSIALALALPLYVGSYFVMTRFDDEPLLLDRFLPQLASEHLPSLESPASRTLRFSSPTWVPRWVYRAWQPLVTLESAWRDREIELLTQRG